MNKLYYTFFLGAYIPSLTLIVYYFTRYYFAYFLMSATYLLTSIVVTTHRPLLNKPLRQWILLKRVAELGMILSFIFRSTYNNEFFTVVMFVAVCSLVEKLPASFQKNIEKPAVYVTMLTLFLSQASIVAQFAGACSCFLNIYEPIVRNIDVNHLQPSLKNYFHLKIVQVYMFFIIEWTLTRLNEWALLFILLGSFMFNAYAYFTLPHDVEDIHSYANINSLPASYAVPLDINEACFYCPEVKQILKDHTL